LTAALEILLKLKTGMVLSSDRVAVFFAASYNDIILDLHIMPQSDRQAGAKGCHHFKSLLLAGAAYATADRVNWLPADL
jgi:hypothetical protein